MDKQLIFFLMLAFLFVIKGAISLNIILLLSSIVIILFLIFDYHYNHEEHLKYKNNYVKKSHFVVLLGNIDLILGAFLLIKVYYGFVPVLFLSFLSVILLIKGLTFVWSGDIASVIDILSSLIILSLNHVEVSGFVLIAISIYLLQKGFMSYFS